MTNQKPPLDADGVELVPEIRVVDEYTFELADGTTESGAEFYVLGILDERADEHHIDGLDSKTVAEYETNAEYPVDDRVVRCVSTAALDRLLGSKWWDWGRVRLLDELQTETDTDSFPRVYSYPASRLRRRASIFAPRDETSDDHLAESGGDTDVHDDDN